MSPAAALYAVNVVYTAVLAGFMISYVVTMGNAAFFDAANGFRGCIPGLHEVLRRQGIFKNTLCLDPDERLSPVQKEEIDRVYAMYPHLNDDDFVRDNLSQWAMVPDGDKKL